MRELNIGIVGLGLIGGSLGLRLKKLNSRNRIIGVDQSKDHCGRAMELKIVDEVLDLAEAVEACEVIILAMPVHVIAQQLPKVLDLVDQQVVFDVGSTKHNIIESIAKHPKRGRFVACHPMAGTEFSGPDAALLNLFEGNYNVICNPQDSDEDALQLVEELLKEIGMSLLYQDSEEHDTHVAYVSHISHLSAFALALTVLHKEKSEEKIFQLAGGGFRSSVRLAKSNPETWSPIFAQNRDAVMDVLDEHITVLSKFRSLLIKKDFEQFGSMLEEANQITTILNKNNHKS